MPFVITPNTNKEMPDVRWDIPAGNPANHRIVTGSPKGGSGKTSTMVFAATTLAQMGARVLVVEATEGQAPLTQAYHPLSLLDENVGQVGLGSHLYQGLSVGRDESTFSTAYAKYRPVMDREARKALESMGKVYTNPAKSRSVDFLACGEELLARVQATPIMQLRHHRRALFASFLDALAAAHPAGGWDFIFIDTLPAVESTITKAAMGVADSYAVVVDVESSHPLTGWGAIQLELGEISDARHAEGVNPNIFSGLILNKVSTQDSKRPLVEKINRYLIACERKNAEANGLEVPVLAEIPRMTLLTLLGFNYAAVEALTRRYGKSFPEDLDLLTEGDIEAMFRFRVSVDSDEQQMDSAAGLAWLSASLPGHRKRLEEEAERLIPMLFRLTDNMHSLDEYIDTMEQQGASR